MELCDALTPLPGCRVKSGMFHLHFVYSVHHRHVLRGGLRLSISFLLLLLLLLLLYECAYAPNKLLVTCVHGSDIAVSNKELDT